ncbi:hypothetical protein [Streptomyces sp. bgisy153]|uniref:hypothetical protein n=1 Tax=Streptomyces sp. bgisy153 TaxID=3413793 RepID=UPI003D747F1D
MRHTHEPPSLLPAAGQERTHTLLIAGVPLLLLVLIGVVPQLGSDDGASGASGSDRPGGYFYRPPDSYSAPPDTSPTYETAPSPPTPEATSLFPDPFGTLDAQGGETAPSAEGTGSVLGTVGTPDPGSSEDAGSPAATVSRYFEAINARDYRTAWDLGGKNLDSSYASFVSGFSDTARDEVTLGLTVAGRVPVDLVAVQTDGTRKSYSGYYTVADGVITEASMSPTG